MAGRSIGGTGMKVVRCLHWETSRTHGYGQGYRGVCIAHPRGDQRRHGWCWQNRHMDGGGETTPAPIGARAESSRPPAARPRGHAPPLRLRRQFWARALVVPFLSKPRMTFIYHDSMTHHSNCQFLTISSFHHETNCTSLLSLIASLFPPFCFRLRGF